MDQAVNKRFLSTGETGELVRVNVGFDSNPGVVCAPRKTSLPTGEKVLRARICGMLGIRAERAKALLSTKRALGVGAETVWLPGMDSNHDSRLQRPLSYR